MPNEVQEFPRCPYCNGELIARVNDKQEVVLYHAYTGKVECPGTFPAEFRTPHDKTWATNHGQ